MRRAGSGQPRPVGGHAVAAGDGPQGDDVGVGPLVAHDAHGLDRQQHGEGLPDLVVQVRAAHFLDEDGVGLAQDSAVSLALTSPRIRTARPGPGNGCRQIIGFGRPSSRPTRRTSSLNSSRSGSISSNLRFFGRPPTLWWVLIVADGPPRGRAALDHVRVERALREEPRRAEPPGLLARRRG